MTYQVSIDLQILTDCRRKLRQSNGKTDNLSQPGTPVSRTRILSEIEVQYSSFDSRFSRYTSGPGHLVFTVLSLILHLRADRYIRLWTRQCTRDPNPEL